MRDLLLSLASDPMMVAQKMIQWMALFLITIGGILSVTKYAKTSDAITRRGFVLLGLATALLLFAAYSNSGHFVNLRLNEWVLVMVWFYYLIVHRWQVLAESGSPASIRLARLASLMGIPLIFFSVAL